MARDGFTFIAFQFPAGATLDISDHNPRRKEEHVQEAEAEIFAWLL